MREYAFKPTLRFNPLKEALVFRNSGIRIGFNCSTSVF